MERMQRNFFNLRLQKSFLLLVLIWKLRSFNELNTAELYAIMALRQEVFVVEQTCFYQDADGADLYAFHVLGYDKGELVAYLRIIPAEHYKDKKTSIGRVAVKLRHRNTGLGKALFLKGMKTVEHMFGDVPVVISAQHRLLKFYTDLGFTAEGDVYLEDDIPHIKMLGRTGN